MRSPPRSENARRSTFVSQPRVGRSADGTNHADARLRIMEPLSRVHGRDSGRRRARQHRDALFTRRDRKNARFSV